MLQPRRDLDLAFESLDPHFRGHLRAQNLEGHLAAMLAVFYEEHYRRAPGSKLAFHGVSLGEDLPQLIDQAGWMRDGNGALQNRNWLRVGLISHLVHPYDPFAPDDSVGR